MNNKLFIGLIVVGIAAVLFIGGRQSNDRPDTNSDGDLQPATSFRDVHGLAVDVENPDKLYIASHNGLYMLQNDEELFLIGKGRDDYMGFSAHPTNSDIFFTSGHPSRGGNLGFQKSTDGGVTWKKISNGLNGPVDFHSMTVDLINPDIVYGVYRGQMQKSTDGGKSWSLVEVSPEGIIQLAAGPKQNLLYAATTEGILRSSDQADTWVQVPGLNGTVISLAAHPSTEEELFAFSQQQGFVKTTDSGKSWQQLSTPFSNEMVMYQAYDKNNPDVLYVITRSLVIYKTTDSGTTWHQIRY